MIPILVLAHLAILLAKASKVPVRGDIGHKADYEHDEKVSDSRPGESMFTKEIMAKEGFRYGVVKINVKNTTEMGCKAQHEFIVEKNDSSGIVEKNDFSGIVAENNYTGLSKVTLDANKAVILGHLPTPRRFKKKCRNYLSTQYPGKCDFNTTHYECKIDLVPANQASGGNVEYKIEKEYGVFSLYHQGQPVKNAADKSDLRFPSDAPCRMLDEYISFDIKLHAKSCPVLDDTSDGTCDFFSSSYDREGCVKYLNKKKDFFELVDSKIEVDVSQPYYEPNKQIHNFRDFKDHFTVIKKIPGSQDDEDVLWTAARKTDIVRRNVDGLGLSFGLGNHPIDEQNIDSTGVLLQSKKPFNSGLFIARVKTHPRSSCGLSAYLRIRGTGTNEVVFFFLKNKVRLEPFVGANCVFHKNVYEFPSNSGTDSIYAIEKTSKYIRFWLWNNQEADKLVDLFNPDPMSWGKPTLEFIHSKTCDISVFDDGKLEFEVAMCEKLQPDTYLLPSECPKTCQEEWKKDPNHWKDARWHIEEISIFKPPPTEATGQLPPPDINGIERPYSPDSGINQPLPYGPDSGNRQQLPYVPDNGIERPSLPDNGSNQQRPYVPDNVNNQQRPYVPDNGIQRPSLPDNGVQRPSLPDSGIQKPSLPDSEIDLPLCEDEEDEKERA